MTRAHPLYLYMMSHETQSYIGVSTNPLFRLNCQNRVPGFASGAKWTRHGAPNWKLDLIIGPFFRGANAFCRQWRDESRKKDCRIAHGCAKAIKYAHTGLQIWAADPQKTVALLREYVKTQPKRQTKPAVYIAIRTKPNDCGASQT
jgi:hypothetical protein